jgi:hypothetical protein
MSSTIAFSQHSITIDGNFEDWTNVPVAVKDSAINVHDTDGYPENGQPSEFFEYSDVDLLEVKFTNDDNTLYGYMKATGIIGRTSSEADGHSKKGRYYFIFTIDVDDNQVTGYPLREGGYWPDSKGYDMNMEVEFYNGAYNTGHYLNHEYISEADYDANWENDLAAGIVRLAPGTYDWYSQWVMFPDSSYVVVEDKGPVYQGIITIAISEDGHEAEIAAPFWGFLKTPEGQNIIELNQDIIVSASLEASGELSEEAARLGHVPGSKSVWGSNTAEPFLYHISSSTVAVKNKTVKNPATFTMIQNYPNPFNNHTTIKYFLLKNDPVQLFIYNANGQLVSRLIDENQNTGEHSTIWNGTNDNREILSSGIYFAVLKAGNEKQVRRMVLLK